MQLVIKYLLNLEQDIFFIMRPPFEVITLIIYIKHEQITMAQIDIKMSVQFENFRLNKK